MEGICPKCGLPKNICVCVEIAKESQKIKIRMDRRRFGKIVTTVSGIGKDIDIHDLAMHLKKKLACGGTIKGNEIELQGSHKDKAKKVLLEQGYKDEQIDA